MGKKRSASLLLIPVLFLFACQPTDLDRVGDTQSEIRSTQTLGTDKTGDYEGYSEYKQLSLRDAKGVNHLSGVTTENLRLNSMREDYFIYKEILKGLNSTTDKSTQDIEVSDTVKIVQILSDNGKQNLTLNYLDGEHIFDLNYKHTFDNLEDFEVRKKTFDTLIHDTMVEYKLKEVIVESPTILNPITYQVYSHGLKHFVVTSTNDSYGRYVLNIRYIVSTNIEHYLKAEYPSALQSEGVLSVDALGQYEKTKFSSRLAEDFIPQLSETLNLTLDGYLIEDKGIVQETTFNNEDYAITILSEEGYVVFAEIEFLGDSLTYDDYKKKVNALVKTFKGVKKSKNMYNESKEITLYSTKEDALVEERTFGRTGVNRLYFMNLTESDNFIEYQLLRGLGTSYMNYR